MMAHQIGLTFAPDIDGAATGDESGYSVSLSDNGSKVAIGAIKNDDNGMNSGHVRVYEFNNQTNQWDQMGSDIDGEAYKTGLDILYP